MHTAAQRNIAALRRAADATARQIFFAVQYIMNNMVNSAAREYSLRMLPEDRF